jgi:uncharacterized protein (TIGR02679 family)
MPNQYDGPEFRRLLKQARRSLERTGGELSGSVSLSHPDDAERKAIIGITGQYRGMRANRIAVRLADLDHAVRETTGRGLPELLAELDGPLRDRPAERSVLAGARDAAIREAETSSLYLSCAWYRDWLAEIGQDGTLTKLINQDEQARLGQAIRVLEYMAGRQHAPVLLPALAADVTGDTKALNHGTLLSTLVLRALAIKTGMGRPGTARERRDLWEAGDVVVDDLASRVLVLNLSAEGTGLAEWLAGAARHGVPFYVTLHQLMTLPLTIRDAVVYVCENPAVLRHATAELGSGSAPLLCTEGRPSTAFHQLADVVVSGGGELRYHGDFDWPGLAIASAVMRRHGARPWRMSADDYMAGVRVHAEHVLLSGRPQPTPWDPELSKAMVATGRVLFEESVADDLIGDLSEQGRSEALGCRHLGGELAEHRVIILPKPSRSSCRRRKTILRPARR